MKIERGRKAVLAFAVLVTISAAAVRASADEPIAKPTWTTVASQPVNVGDAAMAALSYHASGAYAVGLKQIDDAAAAWITQRASQVAKPALVLDIDETALSNWFIIERDDFGRPIAGSCDLALDAPCGWAAWDQLGRDPPIVPTLQLFRAARRIGVAVFFITGRPESQRAATARNLADAGYNGYADLAMVPARASSTAIGKRMLTMALGFLSIFVPIQTPTGRASRMRLPMSLLLGGKPRRSRPHRGWSLQCGSDARHAHIGEGWDERIEGHASVSGKSCTMVE